VTVSDAFTFQTFFDPSFSRTPQPYYERLRETNPVLKSDISFFGDGESMVFLSRHTDIEHALKHPDLFSSRFGQQGVGLGNDRPLIPLQIDPPDHRRYRILLDPLFAPREVNRLEQQIADLVNTLIDGFIERGECEYVNDFAVPLPCTVFLRLLGLPVEDLKFFVYLKEGIIRGHRELDLAKASANRVEAARQCYDYFTGILDERQRQRQDDLLSRLLDVEIEGTKLTREEILDVCFLFLIAGLDTVTDSLTCFYAFLGRSPAHRARLADDPAIIPSAVEEMLRWESPVPMVVRVATTDTEVRGCPVKAGEGVTLCLGSANTDADVLPGAGQIDFDRQGNRHYAFGGGIHRCLGSHLARVELRVSLREWHRRIPDYHIPEDVELQFSPMLRQVEHMPVLFDRINP
jgi:cytochrome P450